MYHYRFAVTFSLALNSRVAIVNAQYCMVQAVVARFLRRPYALQTPFLTANVIVR
jgi:hypothetical protein